MRVKETTIFEKGGKEFKVELRNKDDDLLILRLPNYSFLCKVPTKKEEEVAIICFLIKYVYYNVQDAMDYVSNLIKEDSIA